MPGTGMSLAKFLAVTLWGVVVVYALQLVLGTASRRWPNALTHAAYKVVGGR